MIPGANVSVARNDGMYPVHLAVISGNLKIVKSFVTKTESHNLEKNTKSTTLHLAAQFNQLEIAQYLLKELYVYLQLSCLGFHVGIGP